MTFNISKLRKDLITKRVIELNITTEEAAKQIGSSKATVSRIENSHMPDIQTFGNLVGWLGTKPNDYFVIAHPKGLIQRTRIDEIDVKKLLLNETKPQIILKQNQ